MARFDTTFDASGVEPLTGYELLPPGDYIAQIVESEMRPTRDGNGEFLWIAMDILEGPLQGRKVYDQLNLINPNPTTVEMAQRTLSAICHATGELHVSDSEDLHFKPMTIRVSIRKPGTSCGIACSASKSRARPSCSRPTTWTRPSSCATASS